MPESTGASGARGTAARQEEGGKSMITTVLQGLAIFMLTQLVVNQFFGSKTQTGEAAPKATVNFEDRADATALSNSSAIPYNIAPVWPEGSTIDIQVYVSPDASVSRLSNQAKSALVLDEKNFQIGNYKENREINTNIAIPKEVQHNGTLWAHFLVALA
ncbi:hypothetical protein LTR40_012691, partial [Exophiala xenobiotica]